MGMRRLLFLCAVLTAAGCVTQPGGTTHSFTVWQLPAQTKSQMNSYVIRTVHGKLLAIDGGVEGDAPYLRNFLRERGGVVEAWFVTHPHSDHCNALGTILANPEGIEVRGLYASMPDAAWIETYADPSEKMTYRNFMAALDASHHALTDVALGQEWAIDGVRIEVLGVKNPEIVKNPINNSCMVLRMSDRHKSVLFLADLGFEAGEKLSHGPYADRLPSDYVQMAHHGQNGVGKDVYTKISPKYCLWPTPQWLWDNDSGGGKCSGSWKTLEVRAWMDEFPIRKHYLLFEGLQRID